MYEWLENFFKSAKTIYAIGVAVVGIGVWASNHMVWASDLAKQQTTITVNQLENKKELTEFRKQELEDRILLLEIKQSQGTLRPEEQAILNRYKQRLDQAETQIRVIDKEIRETKK